MPRIKYDTTLLSNDKIKKGTIHLGLCLFIYYKIINNPYLQKYFYSGQGTTTAVTAPVFVSITNLWHTPTDVCIIIAALIFSI